MKNITDVCETELGSSVRLVQLNEKEKCYIPYETATCVALSTANKTLLGFVLILHLDDNISETYYMLLTDYY